MLGVELCICALYSLCLASTFVFMHMFLGAASDEEPVFGYFMPADQGGG